MQKSDLYYMNMAIEEAKKAPLHGDVPIGCVIVLHDEVLAKTHNQRELTHDPTAHAEILALRQAGAKKQDWHLDGATIYVTHEPCPMCAGALINARISTIVYGADEPLYGACGSQLNLVQFPGFPHNIRVRGPIAKEICETLIRDFFTHLRKNQEESSS